MSTRPALPSPLWSPRTTAKNASRLYRYQKWLLRHHKLSFENYEDLHKWSCDDPSVFWESVWQYFNVKSHQPYQKVLSDDPMPQAKWFTGATLNYAEHIFQGRTDFSPALKFASESKPLSSISWDEMAGQVAHFAAYLKAVGVQKGDRVAAYLPNIPEAVIAFLASASIGAVWSSCSPDFGASSVIDRFQQIEPTVFLTVDGYQYNGKPFNKLADVKGIIDALPTLKQVIIVPYLLDYQLITDNLKTKIKTENWSNIVQNAPNTEGVVLTFEPVEFAHPLYILYSSGTTGNPKAITHCHGGILLEHLKYLAFHNDVRAGETFFWYGTTGWMMWNFAVSAMLHGATVLLYDGSPSFPDISALWRLADEAKITHFGTSAPFLMACLKAEYVPKNHYKLPYLRSIGSTGSPLPSEAYQFVYSSVKKDVWLASMSGGTDVCTAWVGGNPLLPVFAGEIQCRSLGCDMRSFDELGNEVIGEVGEMVVLKPMPSMPVYFWNDKNFEKYTESYFEMYNGIWRHGDWLKITKTGACVILGRSDATLNRQGVRIGTAEIYRVLDTISELKDALIVNLELAGGKHFMPLFVTITEGVVFDETLKQKINLALKKAYSPRHVPDEIYLVSDIPNTISGKKMEAPVKKILMGIPLSKAANLGAMRNPESLDYFVEFAKQIK